MKVMMRLWILGMVLLGCGTTAQSEATSYTRSIVCSRALGGDTCEEAAGYDNSNISRTNTYVPPPTEPDTGWNYAAEASAVGDPVSFGLYGRAAGNSFGVPISGPTGMSGNAIVEHHDEVNVSGSGTGFIVVPWHITGAFDVTAETIGTTYGPGGAFGVSFCQSIPVVGPGNNGQACRGGSQDTFSADAIYDKVQMLEYAITFGEDISLNTTFALQAISGASLASGMVGDFSHTGLQQAALVYDSNRNLVLNPVITAASGVDYLNPQGGVVTAPAAVDDGSIAVTEGVANVIPVGANDSNFTDPVTVTVTTPPTKGTISAVSASGPAAGMTITYTANIGAVGADSFVYSMTDSTPATDSATVTVNISSASSGGGGGGYGGGGGALDGFSLLALGLMGVMRRRAT